MSVSENLPDKVLHYGKELQLRRWYCYYE